MPYYHRYLQLLIMMGLTLLPVVGVWAQTYKQGSILIDRAWARSTPPVATTGAGYVTLTNEGTEADRLLEVISPIAQRVEIHFTETTGGMARMRWQKDGVPLPPGKTIEFKPGGLHIMFVKLTQPIRLGTKVPVTLVLERAGRVEVELITAPIGATNAPNTADAGTMQHGKN